MFIHDGSDLRNIMHEVWLGYKDRILIKTLKQREQFCLFWNLQTKSVVEYMY